MSFQELTLLKQYKTYKNDIVKEFYTPVLKEATLYQRAVGFFSSSALIELTKGISGMIRNGGRNGVALTFGFRWELGKNQKHIERVQKTNKTIIGNAINKQIKTTLSCIK